MVDERFLWIALVFLVSILAILRLPWAKPKGRWCLLSFLVTLPAMTAMGYYSTVDSAILQDLFPICVTALFGYISFIFYQDHMNLERNNLVAVLMDRLTKEMDMNTKLLSDYTAKHTQLLKLREHFNTGPDKELMRLYRTILRLGIYTDEEPVEIEGQFLGFTNVYSETPQSAISNLKDGIRQFVVADDDENINELSSLEAHLKDLETSTVYDVFADIQSQIQVLRPLLTLEQLKIVDFLDSALTSFVSMSPDMRTLRIDPFLTGILDQENPLSISLKSFKELHNLEHVVGNSVGKVKRITVEFSLWNQTDTEKIAAYDAGLYLSLSDFYASHSKKVFLVNRFPDLSQYCLELTAFSSDILWPVNDDLIKKVRRAITFS